MKLFEELAIPGAFISGIAVITYMVMSALGASNAATGIVLAWVIIGLVPGFVVAMNEFWRTW